MERTMRMFANDLALERVPSVAQDVHFPEALVRAVLEEYSSPGDTVLDPFAGYGTTLVVSERMARSAVGVELLSERVAATRQRLGGAGLVIEGDARRLSDLGLGPVGLCLTSPPYMNAVDHAENPLTAYGTPDGHYPTYLAELAAVFAAVARLLRPQGFLVINAANIRTGDVVTPLAWDIAHVVARTLILRGTTYLQWDEAPDWVDGDYCLIFQRSIHSQPHQRVVDLRIHGLTRT